MTLKHPAAKTKKPKKEVQLKKLYRLTLAVKTANAKKTKTNAWFKDIVGYSTVTLNTAGESNNSADCILFCVVGAANEIIYQIPLDQLLELEVLSVEIPPESTIVNIAPAVEEEEVVNGI